MRIKVTGQSMRPVIRTNDVVTIRKVPLHEVRRGDLLMVINEAGTLVLHRLIRKERLGSDMLYRTKGDRLLMSDSAVTADRILGKVIRIERQKKDGGSFSINLISFPGRIFHSSMMMIALLMAFRLRLGKLRNQLA